MHLQGPTPTSGDQLHLHVIGVVDDAAHQVFEGIGEKTHASSAFFSAESPDSAFSDFSV